MLLAIRVPIGIAMLLTGVIGYVTMTGWAPLLNYLKSPVHPELKMMLIRELSVCPAPECLETLRRCAEEDPDPRVRNIAGGAFQTAITSARTAATSRAAG